MKPPTTYMSRARFVSFVVVLLVALAACEPDPYYHSGYNQGGHSRRGERAVVTDATPTPRPTSFDTHVEPTDPRELAPAGPAPTPF
ncbi:MAG: hypothetical protein ACJ8KU_03910 [Chthoniobacterales bacterium]